MDLRRKDFGNIKAGDHWFLGVAEVRADLIYQKEGRAEQEGVN